MVQRVKEGEQTSQKVNKFGSFAAAVNYIS